MIEFKTFTDVKSIISNEWITVSPSEIEEYFEIVERR